MRKKLFGEIVNNDGQELRRSLFSNSSTETITRRKLFSDNAEKVCQDCGNILKPNEFVCSNCGSTRFSYMGKNNSAELNETIDKTFSKISSHTRRLLFSNCCACEQKDIQVSEGNIFTCPDCGQQFTDESNTPAGLRCPNCGGNRVVKMGSSSEDSNISDTCDATDETLKEFSGTTNEYGTIEKIFTERGLDLEETINSGYAEYNEETDTVCFSENADAVHKLFSRLVISVTKELELDPVDSKEALIQRLSNSETMHPKAIIMIKKAHGFNPLEDISSSDDDNEDYLKDSGLENDIKLVHGGSTMSLGELNRHLKDNYNDAPDDILDKLVKSGIIDINGSEVKINK